MKKERFNGHIIELYDSIESLPIDRFQAFQNYLTIDSGIGGSVENISNHISMLQKFIVADKRAEALQQLANFQQNLIFVLNNLNPQHSAFACLVYSIDGTKCSDFSESGIKETLELLAKRKFTAGKLSELLNELKKNFIQNWKSVFLPFRAVVQKTTTVR